jgi:hypothetical protein
VLTQTTQTFDSLKDLIAAAHLWDSTVHEAIDLLELEESMYVVAIRSLVLKLTSFIRAPSSPSCSPLRTALHAALQTTQTQSDNVRHVLVGLTSPSSLAQLSEMYAPPSPMKPHTPLHARSSSAITSSRISAVSTPPSDKRATWSSGIPFSYAALANAGSPSRQSLKRWEKRKSDLSALLIRPAISAPATPRRTRLLEGVEEETTNPTNHLNMSDQSDQEVDVDSVVPPEERGEFASAALELQRQRRSRGIEAFLPPTTSPPPKYTPISPQPPLSAHITRLGSKSSQSSPTSPRSSFSASRFTAMQMPRHPLSLHSLTLALNGALAARRYAASHLLALRFGNSDNLGNSERGSESYWEDVRAIMGLLTSALANATAPLIEALDAAERERLRTENPTPTTSHSRSSSLESPIRTSPPHRQEQRRRRQAHRSSSHFASFAPLPSHLARFAAHVDAMTNALDDAREHLESCVASLRDGTSTSTATATATHTHNHRNSTQIIDAPALHTYERLRRELGLALRECERGREPLLELLRPPSADEDEEDEEDRVPALGLDAESSDSDRDVSHARSPPPFSISPLSLSSVRTDTVLVQEKAHRQQQGNGKEDAEAHSDVLVVGLERLPPPGIEQVFEVDADADDDNRTHRRPRPKLSRAERIAAAKVRRAAAAEVPASSLGLSVIALDHGEDTIGSTAEKQSNRWGGPGGDVVQELKDVIWKVGEQRRLREEMMQQQERQQQQQQQLVADAEAAVVVSVSSGDNTVVTRESPSPSPTVGDAFTSLPDPEPLPPTNIA